MAAPEIAVSVVTYQRPRSLALVLESIAAQRGVEGRLELVVTDDGSTDETPQVVEDFRRRVRFPVHFVTHPHVTFQAARCRNSGAAATAAPYLLFVDGDCILPPHHLAAHLEHRRRGAVLIGDVCRLDRAVSESIDEPFIRRGDFKRLLTWRSWRRLRKLDWRYRFYNFIHHPTKPRSLRSGDFGIWRSDYERVNGFDENFCGWGGEDDDLGRRLRRAGIRLESKLRWTHAYHLWHPRDVTTPPSRKQNVNQSYLTRRGRLTRCRNGLVKRDLADLRVRIVAAGTSPAAVRQMVEGRIASGNDEQPAEVELLFLPGKGRFTGKADYNVLVALENSPEVERLVREAHLIVAPGPVQGPPGVLQFPLSQWEQALAAVA